MQFYWWRESKNDDRIAVILVTQMHDWWSQLQLYLWRESTIGDQNVVFLLLFFNFFFLNFVFLKLIYIYTLNTFTNIIINQPIYTSNIPQVIEYFTISKYFVNSGSKNEIKKWNERSILKISIFLQNFNTNILEMNNV